VSANCIISCQTNAVRELNQQLIAEINAIFFNTPTKIENLDVAVAESSVRPLVQPPTKKFLQQVINERGTTLQINSAYRSLRSAVRRSVIRCLVSALGGATLALGLASAPVKAGEDCSAGRVCGTVVNQSTAPWAASVLIANDWNGTTGSGKKHWLSPGVNSSRVFWGTDAVRFTAGCSVQFTVDPA
jgi:hypothetical protein